MGTPHRPELARLKAFYDELELPFATPSIAEIRERLGRAAGPTGSPDDDLRPLALLDFGFLSTAGDQAFDAALAASFWDMYGPRARETEALLDHAIVARFGYDLERLALYRAVYAVVASNAYDSGRRDGHFRWCAALLDRETSGL